MSFTVPRFNKKKIRNRNNKTLVKIIHFFSIFVTDNNTTPLPR